MIIRGFLLCAAPLVLLALTGCEHKFTRERFEMIQVDADDREDVRQILGRPTRELDDQWLYDDLDRHYSAVIYFDDNGRVRGKEWMDARTGEWSGRNPDANPPPQGEVRERRTKKVRIDDD